MWSDVLFGVALLIVYVVVAISFNYIMGKMLKTEDGADPWSKH